jgi:alanine-glyoxylate transaminase/serine-glyoxylate transaminase/serine-pyruvate transaminase
VIEAVSTIRRAIDAAGHDALLIVDAVSALGSTPFRLDAWRVDVALAGSQKGLMPPRASPSSASGPARAAAEGGGSPRHYWDWRPVLRDNAAGFFPYTPATLLLFGLREALRMLVEEETLERVHARHLRLARGVRAAVDAWAPSVVRLFPEQPASASPTLTAVSGPEGADSDAIIRHARERFGLSLGVGHGQLKGKG